MAAAAAVVAVGLQTIGSGGPLYVLSLALAVLAWLVFVVDAVVMLAVSESRWAWARSHWFDLSLLVVTAPWVIVVAHRWLALELLPAFTVLEAAKLAKLAKIVRFLHTRGTGRLGARIVAAVVLLAAIGVGIVVLTH